MQELISFSIEKDLAWDEKTNPSMVFFAKIFIHPDYGDKAGSEMVEITGSQSDMIVDILNNLVGLLITDPRP